MANAGSKRRQRARAAQTGHTDPVAGGRALLASGGLSLTAGRQGGKPALWTQTRFAGVSKRLRPSRLRPAPDRFPACGRNAHRAPAEPMPLNVERVADRRCVSRKRCVSRAMENCPLCAMRNCPLLGWRRRVGMDGERIIGSPLWSDPRGQEIKTPDDVAEMLRLKACDWGIKRVQPCARSSPGRRTHRNRSAHIEKNLHRIVPAPQSHPRTQNGFATLGGVSLTV